MTGLTDLAPVPMILPSFITTIVGILYSFQLCETQLWQYRRALSASPRGKSETRHLIQLSRSLKELEIFGKSVEADCGCGSRAAVTSGLT
jgi:hypothetical protein